MKWYRTVEQTIADMGPLSDTDRDCIKQGWVSGNFGNAYESEDYDAETIQRSLCGTNGFYRVGHLLGFFASYEDREVPEHMSEQVAHYREVMEALGVEL